MRANSGPEHADLVRTWRGLLLLTALLAGIFWLVPVLGVNSGAARDWQSLPVVAAPKDVTGSDGDHTTLLFFWATWCEACKRVMPQLSELSHGDPELRIVAISVDKAAGIEEIRNNARPAGVRTLVLHDRQGSVGRGYAIRALPTSVIVDSAGNVLRTIVGDLAPHSGSLRQLRVRAALHADTLPVAAAAPVLLPQPPSTARIP